MARGHAEALMPMVEAAMAEAGLDYSDLDLIATTVGPGTFTGLRVGISAARALALAADLAITGVSTLEAIAHGVQRERRAGHAVAAVIDARRGEVYVQAFGSDLAPLGPPQALTPDAATECLPAGPIILAGDGAALVAAVAERTRNDLVVVESPRLPDAAVVAEMCAHRYSRSSIALPRQPPKPLYLRPPGAQPVTGDRAEGQ